ncbi:imelysin family protein [Sulfuricurvum sp.]|uniref:imelysin family protein n=1 Tax=Sulfuricurvum sp. TaxID=2025608 RepID=UPI00286E22D3|nr:imelysin family protein [Sulfuricurvum sp.]
MKRIVLILVTALSLMAADKPFPQGVYDEVILADARSARESAKAMVISLEKGSMEKQAFERLAMDWKRVQALYIAGEIDEAYADTPREIDIYHNAKEDITAQLDRIVVSKEEVGKEMFKNSFKTINALEYLLNKKGVNVQRERAMALIAARNLEEKFSTIVQVYEKERKKLLNDESRFNALVMNQLIASSYELKEWRVGEPSGLAKKYKGSRDIRRADLYRSGLSLKALQVIVETHKRVMDASGYVDFGDYAIKAGADSEVVIVRRALASALKNIQTMNTDLFAPASKGLYSDLGRLHNGYYISLIGALKMTSKILDADGD